MSTMMVYVREFDIGSLVRQSSGLVNVILIHIRDDGKVQCFSTSFMSLRERPKRMFEGLKPGLLHLDEMLEVNQAHIPGVKPAYA